MTPDFLIAWGITKGNEGFYSNDPNDPGKETILGLTRISDPSSGVWAIVDRYETLPGFPNNMKNDPDVYAQILAAAQATYFAEYWTPMGCPAIRSQVIKDKLFDASVNIGITNVSLFCQFILNNFNKVGTLWSDVTVDGKIGGGHQTIDAINAMLGQPWGEKVLFEELDGCQKVYYLIGKPGFTALCEALRTSPPPAWRESFELGWEQNRTMSYAQALILAKGPVNG